MLRASFFDSLFLEKFRNALSFINLFRPRRKRVVKSKDHEDFFVDIKNF